MLGSRSCASTSCHGRDDGGPHVSPRGREFAVWLAHDPHARAAQTIQSPRFREILDGVIGEQGAEFRREMELRCAVCHDPVGFEAAKHGVERSKHAVGFTCESCHGAAEHWIAAHYERDITRERLSELGMVDTKNLLARGRQCASCHVGDGECDMNHDMIAAGHPPLRFGSADFEWPALDWKGLAPLEQPPELADAAAVARQLDALAESLHQRLMDRP